MEIPKSEAEKVRARYVSRLNQFGYSPKTLGWDKGKQRLRFSVLTGNFDLNGKSVLDVGAGFGDLRLFLLDQGTACEYVGIDLVPELVEAAQNIHDGQDATFHVGDFLSYSFDRSFDYVFGSGIFNFLLKEVDNRDYIQEVLAKANDLSSEGFAFDFLSDNVDFTRDLNFYTPPAFALDVAYSFSRNVLLRNDYMPFEFALLVDKDDSFDTADTVFSRFKRRHPELMDET